MKTSFHVVHVGDRNTAMVQVPNVYGSGLVTLWENFVWTYCVLYPSSQLKVFLLLSQCRGFARDKTSSSIG
jgi:hypothetical protein